MNKNNPEENKNLNYATFPLVSLVVHNYKGTDDLNKCLNSLMKTVYPNFEIIVADCMTLGIADWLKINYPSVKVMHFNSDHGVPFRMNVAFNCASSESKYVVYLHEDMYFNKFWLTEIIKIMESNPKIGAAQPFLMKSDSSNQIDCGEIFMDFLGYSYLPTMNLFLRTLPHGITAASYIGLGLFRIDALKKSSCNGEFFDSDYRIHWFDIDSSWRIRLAGYEVVTVFDSIIYHKRGVSSNRSKLPAKNIFINNRNWITTLLKNYSLTSLFHYLPPFLCFKFIEFLSLMKINPEHAIATARGVFWPLRNLKKIILKRIIVQTLIRKVPDSYILAFFIKPNLLRLYFDYKRICH